MSVNKDMCTVSGNKRNVKESITAHKLCIAILIRQFCVYRESTKFRVLPPAMKPVHRRDFCILILKLIQSPDLTLAELRGLLLSGKYNIEPKFMDKFDQCIKDLSVIGVGYLLDLAEYISRLTIDLQLNGIWCQINKNSILGSYLRRLMVFFDKLTFAQVAALYEEFMEYYKPCERDILNRLLRDETTDDCKYSIKSVSWDSKADQWSRKQAELFIATQAALLATNEREAQHPVELNKRIRNVLKSNPDLAEAHFLSYLNYLRVKEFCGAIDSIFHSFDRTTSSTESKNTNLDEKSKGFRYAALNLAVLYVQFAHKEEALAALKEAIMLAQEANDNVCLQYALMWLYRLTNTNKDLLIEHSILKSTDLNLTYIASIGIQAYTQHAAFSGGNPRQIFETMTKSDVLNSQHTYRDLISNSFSQKASVWLLYGKTEMSSLWSQILLHLNTDNLTLGKSYNIEGTCQAMCNVANQFLVEGKYKLALAVLKHARKCFPNEPVCHNWMLSECLFTYTKSVYNGDWSQAESAALEMNAIDKWESCIRLGELNIIKSDYRSALVYLNFVIDNCHNDPNFVIDNCLNDPNAKLGTSYKVRAMVLLAELYCSSTTHNILPAGILTVLNSALSIAYLYHLDYLCAIIQMHIANIQLTMGLTTQALKILDRYLVNILANGGRYDRARAMLLYVKCLVAHSKFNKVGSRDEVLLEATEMLKTVKEDFHEVEARSRVKDVLYLQAQLYNELGRFEDRNNSALEYKQYIYDYPIKNSRTLLTSF